MLRSVLLALVAIVALCSLSGGAIAICLDDTDDARPPGLFL